MVSASHVRVKRKISCHWYVGLARCLVIAQVQTFLILDATLAIRPSPNHHPLRAIASHFPLKAPPPPTSKWTLYVYQPLKFNENFQLNQKRVIIGLSQNKCLGQQHNFEYYQSTIQQVLNCEAARCESIHGQLRVTCSISDGCKLGTNAYQGYFDKGRSVLIFVEGIHSSICTYLLLNLVLRVVFSCLQLI